MAGRTEVIFGTGAFERERERLAALPSVWVADANTARFLPDAVPAARRAVLESGEEHKTIASVGRVWSVLAAAGIDRGGYVVAVGGGTVTDVAGFAAATWMRGIRWIAVPTTLVGMCDAALGGKTGIDLSEGKNLAGAFWLPEETVVDPVFLKTLPERELNCGLAEIAKTLLVAGVAPEGFEARLRAAIDTKLALVERDFRDESGERAALNAGHTVGHALEKATGYRLRHGEAVAAGLVIEARLAAAVGAVEESWCKTVADLLPYMAKDKKCRDGEIVMEIPTESGMIELRIGKDPK